MARTFASASSEKIDLSLGAGASLSGAVTIAAIVKKATDSATTGVVMVGNNNTTARQLAIGSSNKLFLRTNNSTAAGSVTQALIADGWLLIAATKAAGTATPRFHFFKYSTNTWTHEGASGGTSVGDSTPTGASALAYNPASNSTFLNGNLAVGGAWQTALTDAQVETLAFSLVPWYSYTPNGLWVLDQAATTTTVWDLTGRGANQSGITGTSVATVAVPFWNRY